MKKKIQDGTLPKTMKYVTLFSYCLPIKFNKAQFQVAMEVQTQLELKSSLTLFEKNQLIITEPKSSCLSDF